MGNSEISEAPVRSSAPSSGRRTLLVNYLLQLVNQGLRMSMQLLLVPLFLAAWGAETYKDWVLLVSTATFLSSCSLGTPVYFGNRFLGLIARRDRAAFQRELRTALFCTLAIGCMAVIIAYALLFGLGSSGVLAGVSMDRKTIYGSLLLLTLPVTFSFSEEALRSIYRAEGEFSRGEVVFALYILCYIICTVAALALKMPPPVVAGCSFASSVLLATGVITDLKRRYSNISLGIRIPSIEGLRHIASNSLLFFTSPLSQAIVQNGPLLLFGALGLPALPILSYTLGRTVTGLARQAAFQFAVGSGIEMARYQANGELESCRQLYTMTGRIVAGLVGLFGGFTLFAAGPFIAVWTHGVVHSPPQLIAFFLAGIFLAAPGQSGLMLLNYANVARPLALAWCAQAGLGMVASAALVPLFGVDAAAVSFAAAEAIAVGLWLPLAVDKYYGFSAVKQIAICLLLGGAGFIWSGVVAKLGFALGLSGLRGLVAIGALWAVIALPPFFVIILPSAERRRLASRARSFALRSG